MTLNAGDAIAECSGKWGSALLQCAPSRRGSLLFAVQLLPGEVNYGLGLGVVDVETVNVARDAVGAAMGSWYD